VRPTVIKFHTASFFDKKNHHGICFSIAMSQPEQFSFPQLKMLVPDTKTLSLFRSKRIGEEIYARRYTRETLVSLRPKTLIEKIRKLCPNIEVTDVTLLCWEPSGTFCHRQLVMAWLMRNKHLVRFAGYEIGYDE